MGSKGFSTYREVFVVVMTILAFAIPGNSFVDHTLNRNGVSVYRKIELQALGFPATRPTLTEEDKDQKIASIDRRAVFLTGASVVAGYFLKEKIPSSNAPAILTTLDPSVGTDTIEASMSTVSSVEEALKIIESRGDKRFLHGVVASDYKFLYEQTKTIPFDIDVEQIFSQKVPPVSNKSRAVVLATTGNLGPKKSASLWPLENAMTSGNDIHYAWPEQGGVLESNKKRDDSSTDVGITQKMIVDGIDCGKMSLEDALEGEMQVLVQAPTYLSVPSYMESSLRKGLRGAFLI
jgi:hypothetical protein